MSYSLRIGLMIDAVNCILFVFYTTIHAIYRMPYSDTTTKEAYQFTVTVTFISTANQVSLDYSPPPPPVLFRIPRNAFYPFSTSAINSASSSSTVFGLKLTGNSLSSPAYMFIGMGVIALTISML